MAKDPIKNFMKILAIVGGVLAALLTYTIQFLSRQ